MSRNPFVNQVVCFANAVSYYYYDLSDRSRNPFVNQVVCFKMEMK